MRLKLINRGGVRRSDDDQSPIYGTVGFQAPEVAKEGTSIASDLYTVARTLAVLIFEFKGYQTKFVDSLPGADDVPIFAEHDSLYLTGHLAAGPKVKVLRNERNLGKGSPLAIARGSAIDIAAVEHFGDARRAERLTGLNRRGVAAHGQRKILAVAASHAERWSGARDARRRRWMGGGRAVLTAVVTSSSVSPE